MTLKGKQLEFLPSLVTTWNIWRTKHPATTVLTGVRAHGLMGAFLLAGNLKRYGLSVGQGRKVKLYPFETLKEKVVIHDTFDGKKIVIVFDAPSATAAAFQREDLEFFWKEGTLKDKSGASWDFLTGTSMDKTLKPLAATPWLIERWHTFYPQAEVYR
ncbi:MAG: hypothetical protein ACK44W_06000 [Planctomycetota bacterium]